MKKILWVVIGILLLNTVLAVPPFQVSDSSSSLTIVYPKNTYFMYGADLVFHFHAYNSTGHLMTDADTDCELHVYNSTGNHIIEAALSFDANEVDFYYDATYTLFPVPGQYGFLVHCNSTTSQDGFASDTFNIQRVAPVSEGLEGFHIAVMLCQLGVLIFLIVLGLKLDEEHYAIKLFFIWLASITLLPFVNTIYQLARDISLSSGVVAMMMTTYYISWAVMAVTTFYFSIYILRTTLTWLGDTVKTKSPKGRRIEKL